MSIPGHVHITERESDGSWENCTEASGLEFYRDAIDDSPPATLAEVNALRKASGRADTGGSNLGDFRKAVLARYGKTLPPAISAHDILTALKPGYCSTVQGSMKVFSSGHRLSVWDTRFDGTHAVYLARGLDGTLLWCDPEAPTGAAVPVVVKPFEVSLFVTAFNGQAIVAPIKSLIPKEDILDTLISYLPDSDLTIKAQSNIRSAPSGTATKLRTVGTIVETHRALGTVKGTVDPANGSSVWYVWFANGKFEFTAKDNVTVKARIIPTAPSYPDVRPQLAQATASLADVTAQRDAVEAELATVDALQKALKEFLA